MCFVDKDDDKRLPSWLVCFLLALLMTFGVASFALSADTVVEFSAPSGLTLTLKTFALGSDVQTSTDSATEATNRLGLYTATISEALAGIYHVSIQDAGGNAIALGYADLADDTSTYRVTGSYPTLASVVVDEWETQSQADPTGFWVNVKEVNNTAQTANDMSGDINIILSDTGAMDTSQELRTLMTGSDTPVATQTAQTTAQADLDTLTGTDGATLATSQPNYAPNTVVPDAAGTLATYDPPTNTEMVAAHTTTDALISGLNDISTSDVATELGTYDGPTNAEMVAAFTEIKGATWDATNTLEAISDAGGGDATEANQTTIIGLLDPEIAEILADTSAYDGTADITVVGPVIDSDAIELDWGDSYKNTHGRRLEWSSADWTDLTSATISFRVWKQKDNYELIDDIAGVVVTPGVGTQTVGVEIDDSDWETYQPVDPNWRFKVVATIAGDPITLATAARGD